MQAEADTGLTIVSIHQAIILSTPFPYNSSIINALEVTLSTDRLSSYLNEVGGNNEEALRLYVWNSAISAALYLPLQGLEIALRNAMNQTLTQAHGAQWYENPATTLAAGESRRITQAKNNIVHSGRTVTASRIVAEVSFGFWVSLLGAGPNGDYENRLWRHALHRAFPNARLKRQDVHIPLEELRELRNRIAHHEPIFHLELEKNYDRIIEVSGWICTDTANWIAHHNNFAQIFAEKPIA